MSVNVDLAIVWAFIIAFAVFMYVVMDGFDLGIGILFPNYDVGDQRDAAMNAIAPVWDGNETWLVLGGGGLMAAFPLAYAVVLPALYPPIVAMLLALVFRGVAFEFRWRDPRHRAFWDFAFTAGSVTAAFAQGVSLGALIQGVDVSARRYAGGWLDWLTPFSLLTGASVIAAYALLGSCWLIWKTEGETQRRAFLHARISGGLSLAAIVAVSVATPFLQGQYFARWLAWPAILEVAIVPLLVAVLALAFLRALAREREHAPFLLALALFGLCFVGLGVSLFPLIVPPSITIWQAAAPENAQVFMAVGAGVMIPIILGYTGWAYWVFRGKVGEGYH